MHTARFFLLAGCWLAACSLAAAQNFTIGPKIGLNLKDFDGKGAVGYSIRPDFNAGLAWNFLGNDVLNIGGELLYSRQGGRLRNTIVVTSVTTAQYLSLPVLLKYYFWSKTRTTPVVFAGPQASYLLSVRNTVNGDLLPQFKRTDISGVVGAGLRMDLEAAFWTLDVRYAPGLQNALKSGAMLRNAVISVNSSIEFGYDTKTKRGLR